MRSTLKTLIVGIVVISSLSFALAMNKSFEDAKVWAQSQSIPNPQNPNNVLGYGGTDIPQSHIPVVDLGTAAQKAMQDNEASNTLVDTSGSRQKYTIDSKADPIMVAANQALSDVQNSPDETISEVPGSSATEEETHTCEEGGDEYNQKCSKRLEIVLKVTPEVGHNVPRYCDGRWRGAWARGDTGVPHWCRGPVCSGCVGGGYVITQQKKVEVVREEWVDDCTALEALADKGLCRYVSKATSPKNEIRMIDGEPVERDHFEEHYQYACFKSSSKSCVYFREKGCYQVNSICKEKVDGQCILWEQTYRCPSGTKIGKRFKSSNKNNPFCLTGDCADTSYKANTDLFEVMSKLSVLKEAQNDLRQFATIFKGQDRRCTRNCIDFRDCCGSGKGWGVSLKLANCDAEEKELRTLRDKNRCVMIGTYCAEKLLGKCIRKKTTFCCYSTKLAKIVQEQGRGQIGLNFGSPQQPQCQGLSAEQLSKMDFEKINFSELFQDIAAQTKVPDPQRLTKDIQQSMKDRASHLAKPLPVANQAPKIQGRDHGNF